MSAGNPRFDWYQTESHVVVTILIKNLKKEDVAVSYEEKNLSVTIKLPTGSDYSLELDLAHKINGAKCITRVLSTKVECKMMKIDAIRWNKLEGEDDIAAPMKSVSAEDEAVAHKYPSSAHYTKNWDKLVADITEEEKKEEPEGDAALNKLFQGIYKDSSDEVRKAMNKSFVESGGTVLSTNWDEIKQNKVEMKPPDGLEYKKY